VRDLPHQRSSELIEIAHAVVVAAALLLGGCDAASTTTDGGADSATPADMVSLGLGCTGFVGCYNACGNSVDAGACVAGCEYNTTGLGLTIYGKALYCGQAWCLGLNMMGPGDCALDSTMTMLIDPAGKPAGTCTSCLANALAQLYGVVCMPAGDPNCNPMGCQQFYTDCANSVP
jgi:hypothetical protein